MSYVMRAPPARAGNLKILSIVELNPSYEIYQEPGPRQIIASQVHYYKEIRLKQNRNFLIYV